MERVPEERNTTNKQELTTENTGVDSNIEVEVNVEDNSNRNEEQSNLLNSEDVPVDGDVVQDDKQNTVPVTTGVLEETEINSNIERKKKINVLLRISFLIGGLFGAADIVTDFLLVYQYALEEQYLYFGLTSLFIWLPSLMTTITLYRMCKQEDRDSQLYKCLMKWKWSWLCIWPLLFICQMSSAVYALIHALSPKQLTKDKRKTKQKQLLDLQLIDVFNEAAPQSILQYYILETSRTELEINRWWQLISIYFSCFTIARVALAHLRYYRTEDRNKTKFQLVAKYFINGLLIGTKIGFISVAFVLSPIDTVCCTVIHIVLCYTGLGYLQWKSPNNKPNLTHWFTFPAGSLFYVHVIDKSIFSYCIVPKLPLYKLYYVLYYLEFIIFTIICVYNSTQIIDVILAILYCFIVLFIIIYNIYNKCVTRAEVTNTQRQNEQLQTLELT